MYWEKGSYPASRSIIPLLKFAPCATFDVQFDINNTKNNSFLPQLATGRPNTETVVNRTYDGDIDLFGVTHPQQPVLYSPVQE